MPPLFTLPLAAIASRWTRRPQSRDAERALHAAADHADLKRLVEAQVRLTAARWWPGGPR